MKNTLAEGFSEIGLTLDVPIKERALTRTIVRDTQYGLVFLYDVTRNRQPSGVRYLGWPQENLTAKEVVIAARKAFKTKVVIGTEEDTIFLGPEGKNNLEIALFTKPDVNQKDPISIRLDFTRRSGIEVARRLMSEGIGPRAKDPDKQKTLDALVIQTLEQHFPLARR